MRRLPRAAVAVALAVLTLAGLVLRCYALGHRGLWWDEACLWSEAFTRNAAYQEAPLNTWLTRLTMELVRRDDTLALHLPALLFGTLHIPAAFLLGRALAGRAAGLTCALFVTFSPPLLFFAQEARPYALLILLTTLQLMVAVLLLDEFTWRRLGALALLTSAAIATHLLALPFSLGLGALATAVLVTRRLRGDARAPTTRQLLAFVLVGAAALALGASWTLLRPSMSPVMGGRYEFGPLFFVRFVLENATTFAARMTSMPRPLSARDAIAAAWAAGAVAGIVVLAWRGRLPAALLLVAAPLALLVSLYYELGEKSVWIWSRYATPATVPLYALAAVGVSASRRAWLTALLALGLTALDLDRATGMAAWAADARVRRGEQFLAGAETLYRMQEQLRGIVFVMQRSAYSDETSRAIASYEQFRRDDLPQFYTHEGQVFGVRLERGPGRVPIPVLEDALVALPPGDYAVYDGWDKRGCAAYAPSLRDSPLPSLRGAFRFCRVP
jgi:hypothetical protein